MKFHLYTNMPVTTRSQTRASRFSSSYIETSTLASNIPSSTNSLVEASHVYATDYTISDLSLQQPSSIHHELIQPDWTDENLSSSLLVFQTSPENFKLSKIPCYTFELPVKSGSSMSHKFSISNNLIMEEDCEEGNCTMMSNSSTLVDIEKLFTAFTHQIAGQIINQTNTLRNEIRVNELRIMQDNENFKNAMRD
jgi:hypothetical protein